MITLHASRLLVLFSDLQVQAADDFKHDKVYAEPGRFGGFPANHGIWIWKNEILVGFSAGFDKDLGERHHIDREKPEEHLLARSKDGGETWTVENPSRLGRDGGKSWEFTGWIAPEPKGYSIMPSAVRLGPDEFLSAIRCREGIKVGSKHSERWTRSDSGDPARIPSREVHHRVRLPVSDPIQQDETEQDHGCEARQSPAFCELRHA